MLEQDFVFACCLVAREKGVRGGSVLLRRGGAPWLAWTVAVVGFARVQQVRGVAIKLLLLDGS